MERNYRKHLSTIANEVLHRCADSNESQLLLENQDEIFRTLGTTVDGLVEEFEVAWKLDTGSYARKLVEYCSSKALCNLCRNMEDKINDGSFSRFTFNMMVAWERPSSTDDEFDSERVAKEKEDKKLHLRVAGEVHDDIPLFYSDLMPLLVDNEPSVGEDAYVWMGSLIPLAVDVVNGRFTFESLTIATAHRLYFPAYDKFLQEIDKCVKYLQKQATPTGVELADDEYILHVEGNAKTQRVVRHIGGTSWPGRLTLTNRALYFEAYGVVSYEKALKIDLSKNIDHNVKRTATGPWGAPLFDKAITYESPELSDSVVLEFPEMTSSTRRDHWFALIKEVILLHQFLSKFNIVSSLQMWEMHSRTILAILRLHAAREMLRMSPPSPHSFLIFALFDELPKGDFVLQELSNNLKQLSNIHPCSGSSILKRLNMSHPSVSSMEIKEEVDAIQNDQTENFSSWDTTINQVREEAREVSIAKATTEGLKEEGIGDSLTVLLELLSPLKRVVPWFQEVLSWKRPVSSILVLFTTLLIIYKEWIGKAIAGFFIWAAALMLCARHERIKDRHTEIVVSTSSDQTTMETIVSAQHGLNAVRKMVQTANITILKIQSIFLSKAAKHGEQVMLAMVGLAILLAIVPLKIIITASVAHVFLMNSKIGKYLRNEKGRRRLKEWWDSIPVVPVRTVNQNTAAQS